MSRSNEAFWWSLFSAGGVVSALFIPVFILMTGFILPFVSADHVAATYRRLHLIVSWWPVRIVLFVVLFFTFFHCAHRIRHVLISVGVGMGRVPLAVLCYSGALAGAVATVIVLLGF